MFVDFGKLLPSKEQMATPHDSAFEKRYGRWLAWMFEKVYAEAIIGNVHQPEKKRLDFAAHQQRLVNLGHPELAAAWFEFVKERAAKESTLPRR